MTEQGREMIERLTEALAEWSDLPDEAGISGLTNDLTFGDIRKAAAELERLYADNARKDRAINRLLDEIGEEIHGSNELFQAGEEARAALNLSEDGR